MQLTEKALAAESGFRPRGEAGVLRPDLGQPGPAGWVLASGDGDRRRDPQNRQTSQASCGSEWEALYPLPGHQRPHLTWGPLGNYEQPWGLVMEATWSGAAGAGLRPESGTVCEGGEGGRRGRG